MMKGIVRTILAGALVAAAPSAAWALCDVSSFVRGSATQTSPGLWTYSFMVQNGCVPNHQPMMTDFYLPFFADAGIGNFVLPPVDNFSTTSSITWGVSIDANNNLFNLPGAGVIDFHVTTTPEIQVASDPDLFEPGVGYYFAEGFSFTASFGGVEGPDAIQTIPFDGGLFQGTQLLFGDPPIPGSPNTIAALAETATPEPATVGLMAIGLVALLPMAARRKKVG